ncbi:MAG: serine hydrolase domain-containing protein [Maricaulaceae bacterium]
MRPFEFNARGAAVALSLVAAAALGACTTAPQRPADLTPVEDPSALGFDPAALDEVRAALAEDVEEGAFPGAVFLIVRDGQVVLNEQVGVHSADNPTPVTDQSLFRIFSMTKPVVTVAAMTLVEEGALDLDAPVSDYIPAFADATVYVGEGESRPATSEMKVRHLMSHTSGLIYGFIMTQHPLTAMYDAAGENRSDITARELADGLGELPLIADPGTAWNYSRSTDVLGAVVEVAAGQPLDVVLQERIFDPLGMDDTSFYPPVSENYRLAFGTDPNPILTPLVEPQAMLSGGGGLVSTAEDYYLFASMLANRGELDGVRIIEPETLDAMLVDQTTPEIRSNGLFFPGPGVGFGLGFQVVLEDSANRPEEPGAFSWFGIAGTNFWVDPGNDLFAVLMIQNQQLASRYQNIARGWVYGAMAEEE